MGYSTDFRGEVTLDKPLTPEHAAYLKAFSGTRRMKRDPEIAATLPDPIREAAGLPVGEDGEFFVGNSNDNNFAQTDDKSVIEHNRPPKTQPGLWCQWTADPYNDEQLDQIGWDEGEKFYEYIKWMKYIIKNFIKPWGYVANGSIEWRGESWDDTGIIEVKNNIVK